MSNPNSFRLAACLCAGLMMLSVAACSSSSSGSNGATDGGSPNATPNGTTTYKGTFAGPGEGGSIEITVTSGGTTAQDLHTLSGVQQVTGTVHVSGGSSITVTGTFDPATNQLSVTGGGYTFSGTASSNGVTGSYQGPKGSGSFSVLTGASVTPYCGTFAGDATGVWNMVVSGSTITGTAMDDKGHGDQLTGTVDASGNISMTTKNGSNAPGKITGNTASGTWQNSAGNAKGTWQGTAGCQ